MKVVFLFCVCFQVVAGMAPSPCRPSAYRGQSTGSDIPFSCTSYQRAFVAGSGGVTAIHMYRYTLENNTCSVYEGSDKNGVLLGTFTGDGSATGIVKSNTGSMFLSCPRTPGGSFNPYFAFIEVQGTSCDLELNVDDLPTSLILPTSSNGKLLQYQACNYTVTSPVRRNFTISTTGFRRRYGNGLYIVSDDPSHPGIFVDDPQVMKVQARRVSVLLFTYAFPSPSPTIHIDSDTKRKPHDELECINTLKFKIGDGKTTVGAQKNMGNFAVSFELFHDKHMESPLTTESTVTVPNFIYGKVMLLAPGTKLSMQLERCWITDLQSGLERYNLINQGCKVVHGVEDSVGVMRNYQTTCAKFKFRTFAWNNVSVNQQSLYAHCYVQLCDNTNTVCTQPDCSRKRKRRSVDPGLKEVISVGPFYVSVPDLCEKENGGCSDICNFTNGLVDCSCFKGRYLERNKKICTGVNKSKVKNQSSSKTESHGLLIGFIVLLVIAVLPLVGCFVRRFFKTINQRQSWHPMSYLNIANT